MKLPVCFHLSQDISYLFFSLFLSLSLSPSLHLSSPSSVSLTQAREDFALALSERLDVADAALKGHVSHKDKRKRKRIACWGYFAHIIVIHANQTSRQHLVLGTPPAIQLERHGELTRPQSASHAHPPAGVIARPSEGSQAHNF